MQYTGNRQRKSPASLPADGGIPLAKLIAPFLKTLRLEETRDVNHLQERWETTLGKGVAAHTRPGSLHNGELVVFVDSSPWLSELKRYASREMLANLQKAFGKETIRCVRLQLDPGA